eukprot:CAMPEP_0117609286 /NCGR_PEP_ID=MMETSP0784-20121206/81251_1 /TAXON_ID=39447 /ORGANISM="" /LENGTH=44 /DNA_ID= /DNA_START= /DNA_END= /DNA_ORIENTATION=
MNMNMAAAKNRRTVRVGLRAGGTAGVTAGVGVRRRGVGGAESGA